MRWILAALQMFVIGLMLGLVVGREQGEKRAQAICDGGVSE